MEGTDPTNRATTASMSGFTSNNSWKNKARTMGKHGASPRDGGDDGGGGAGDGAGGGDGGGAGDGAGGGDDGDGGIPEKKCPFDLLNS